MAKAVVNFFYRGPEGLKQHIQLEFVDELDEQNNPILARDQVVSASREVAAALVQGGATREELPTGLPAPVQPVTAPQAPRSPQVFQPGPQGAGVARVHQACGNPMQFVPAGVSRTTGRAYPAFFKCNAGCVGQSGRAYTENA